MCLMVISMRSRVCGDAVREGRGVVGRSEKTDWVDVQLESWNGTKGRVPWRHGRRRDGKTDAVDESKERKDVSAVCMGCMYGGWCQRW